MEAYNKLNTLIPTYVKKTFLMANIQSRLVDTKKIIDIIIKETETAKADDKKHFTKYGGATEETYGGATEETYAITIYH